MKVERLLMNSSMMTTIGSKIKKGSLTVTEWKKK